MRTEIVTAIRDLSSFTPDTVHLWKEALQDARVHVTFWGERSVEFLNGDEVVAAYSIAQISARVYVKLYLQDQITNEHRAHAYQVVDKLSEFYKKTVDLIKCSNVFTQLMVWIRGEFIATSDENKETIIVPYVDLLTTQNPFTSPGVDKLIAKWDANARILKEQLLT